MLQKKAESLMLVLSGHQQLQLLLGFSGIVFLTLKTRQERRNRKQVCSAVTGKREAWLFLEEQTLRTGSVNG